MLGNGFNNLLYVLYGGCGTVGLYQACLYIAVHLRWQMTARHSNVYFKDMISVGDVTFCHTVHCVTACPLATC